MTQSVSMWVMIERCSGVKEFTGQGSMRFIEGVDMFQNACRYIYTV